jgi:hypothetical protein
MPDISLCLNEECPSSKKCYRSTATPNPGRQTYCGFTVKEGEKKCEYFIDNKNYENRN